MANTKTIDGIDYPAEIQDILKTSRPLALAVAEHMKKESSYENFEFLVEVGKKSNKEIFEKFIEVDTVVDVEENLLITMVPVKNKPRTPINISYQTVELVLQDIARDNWSGGNWAQFRRNAVNEIIRLANGDPMFRFWKSAPFKQLHAKALAATETKRKAGIKAADEQREQERLKKIAKTGVDPSIKKLRLCGFENPTDPSVKKNLIALYQAHQEGRKGDAVLYFNRLKKAEESLAATKYDAFMKLLKQFKVIKSI